MEHHSHSLKKTKAIAANLAKTLKGGEIIALFGELGAGKTTFTQFLAQGLSIKKRVLSPTFVLLRSYPIPKLPGKTLHHLDLYRLQSEANLKSVDLNELISPHSILIVEWAEKIKTQLPADTINIKLTITGQHSRRISIIKSSNFR